MSQSQEPSVANSAVEALENDGGELVDVVIPTFNSNRAHFPEVLRAVRREVPVHHLVVTDRFSSDGTVEAIRAVFPKAVIIQSNSRLSRALCEAFTHIDTETFAFLDDDIVLGPGWYASIRACLNLDRVGAAYSAGVTRRAGTYETDTLHLFGALIKTDLIKNWDAPEWLSVGANILMGRHIKQKGFRILVTSLAKTMPQDPTPGFSLKLAPYYFKKGRWEGSGVRVVGIPLREILLGGFMQMSSNLRRRRLRQHFGLLASSSFFAGEVVGWFSWRKYHDWQRPSKV